MNSVFKKYQLTRSKRKAFAVGLERIVRWWHRLIDRNKIYCGFDSANGVDTTCFVEYDTKTKIYTVLDIKENITT